MSLPEEDRLNHHRKAILDFVAVTMAGRIAEELVAGDVSSGAAGDIQQATNIARAMVCQWGMSEKLGPMTFGKKEDPIFLGREINQAAEYSQATAVTIDEEVRRIITAEAGAS